MTDYNWRVHVRITGTRDGWGRTLVDTPTFELRSNAQFGGIWSSADSVASVARDMFAGLTESGDQVHVTVSGLDELGTVDTSYTFGDLGA